MTHEQIQAITCAYLDLVGALEAFQEGDMALHDWKAHELTIEELREAFLPDMEGMFHPPASEEDHQIT